MGAVQRILENNLAAIVMGLIAVGASYLVGTTRTDARLTALEAFAADQKTRQSSDTAFKVCVARSLDHLNTKAGGEPPCQILIP